MQIRAFAIWDLKSEIQSDHEVTSNLVACEVAVRQRSEGRALESKHRALRSKGRASRSTQCAFGSTRRRRLFAVATQPFQAGVWGGAAGLINLPPA